MITFTAKTTTHKNGKYTDHVNDQFSIAITQEGIAWTIYYHGKFIDRFGRLDDAKNYASLLAEKGAIEADRYARLTVKIAEMKAKPSPRRFFARDLNRLVNERLRMIEAVQEVS
jgi:hypothetical protein